jgi:circadian clock protein KaiC
MHLATTHKLVNDFKPDIVIMDPINTFVVSDKELEIKTMLIRIVDFLKANQITALFTSLTDNHNALENTDVGISSIIDTWLLLRDIEIGGERNRGLYILKSRGMAHSNQIREFLLTDHGVELRDVYVGPSGVLTGSARLAQEAQEHAAQTMHEQEVERRKLELERKRSVIEAQIVAMRAEFEAQEVEMLNIIEQEHAREAHRSQERVDMALSRKADEKPNQHKRGSK